jgi:hypothetical protein
LIQTIRKAGLVVLLLKSDALCVLLLWISRACCEEQRCRQDEARGGLPLVAHLTVHWSLTDIGDDPGGKLFAKVRGGLDKWLDRQAIVFAAAWARERQCSGQSDVEHCHLLFHLPVEYRSGKRLAQINGAMRLVRLHGGDILHEKATDLRVHADPDGKYLIKGGGSRSGSTSVSGRSIAACRASFTVSVAA